MKEIRLFEQAVATHERLLDCRDVMGLRILREEITAFRDRCHQLDEPEPELRCYLAELKVRADRRLGLRLPKGRNQGGARKPGHRSSSAGKHDAYRCRRLAMIPSCAFETALAQARDALIPISVAALLRVDLGPVEAPRAGPSPTPTALLANLFARKLTETHDVLMEFQWELGQQDPGQAQALSKILTAVEHAKQSWTRRQQRADCVDCCW